MRFRVIAMVLGLAIAVAGCGSDGTDDAAAAGAESAAPVSAAAEEVLASSSTTAAESSTTTTEVPATTTTTTTTAPPQAAIAPPRTAERAPVSTEVPTTAAAPVAEPVAPPTTVPAAPPQPPAASGKPCIVSLHGKGGGGQGEWTGSDGVRHSFPAGNAAGEWGGLQWLYYPESNYQATRNIVANNVAAGGCGRVIVYGFSNGAAFAAKLYCRGETFGGTVIGYVIDDPVVDHAVEGCARPPVKVVMYWTGDIDQADGWPCGDWTCEGGSTIGIARYEAAIGIGRKPSIHSSHQQYHDPPELHSWF